MATVSKPQVRPAKSLRRTRPNGQASLEYFDATLTKFVGGTVATGIVVDDGITYEPDGRRRMRFVPLKSAARFILVDVSWTVPHPFVMGESEEEREARDEQWRQARSVLPGPAHALDIPVEFEASPSGPECDEDIPRTREQAFADAARLNAAAPHDDNERATWWVVFELGEPLENVNVALRTINPGRGEIERTVTQPMRIVTPTAAEVAKFAVSA